MRLISCAVKQSDRPSTENGKKGEKKMCYFPISSMSVPILGLKTLLWWGCGGEGCVYYIANKIAKKKKKERARYKRIGSGLNYNQANLT